ncbi:MAG: hypothetical protein ACOX0X_03240 [Candidatus Dojkabacteria bacterium]
MNNFSFKDFFTKYKKVIIIISTILILTIVLLLTFFLTDSFKGVIKNSGSNPEKESSENRYYSATVENDNPNCTLTKIEYPESAFSIGVPNGWLYEVNNGTVSIMEDQTNTTAVFLYTAKLKKDLTKKEFLTAFSTIFKRTIEASNGTFDIQNIQESENEANADIVSKIDGYDIKGRMSVSQSGEFVTFKSYWAPVKVYAEKEGLLKDICGCFARTRVLTDDVLLAAKNKDSKREQTPAGFQTYKGKYFRLDKPSNFQVTGETDSGIDLTRTDGKAGFSYAYATGFEGAYTPRSWAQKALPEFAKIQNLKLTNGAKLPSQISGHSVQEFSFTGNLSGISVVGKVTVGVYQAPYFGFGTKYSSAFWAIQISTPENWTSVKATLQKMQDSFTITDIGATRKNTLLPSNRPMESTRSSVTSKGSTYSSSMSDESSENWAEGMRGYETVTSPSTGQTYDVPLNSWSSYGPEGPGYYRELPNNSLEKLQ